MKNRAAIASIRGTHRLLSADAGINDRVILAELKATASVLIRRELNLRKLTTTDSIYTKIDCVELQEVPLSECCDYVDECTIARTKYPLPRIQESNYQLAIQGVFSINQSVKLVELTPSRYINVLKLPKRKKETYYWFQNNYLYITSPEITTVKLIAFFEDEVPKSILYPEGCESCKCGKPVDLEDLCRNPLDEEFKCPAYLIKPVQDLVSDKLMRTYFHTPTDNSADGIDNQAPNNVKSTKT